MQSRRRSGTLAERSLMGAAFLMLSLLSGLNAAPVEAAGNPHSEWSAILKQYVRDGHVDYAGLKARGQRALDGYLKSLEAVTKRDYAKWDRNQRLAFWINAYNAYTVRLILDHHPLESIRSIGLLRGAAFRKNFIPLESLRGSTLSLNDLEHEILRKEFKEPRIHFALVCASKGCPPLPSRAFAAKTLDKELEEATRAFLADASKNRFDPATRTLHLSPIFKWFREDFEAEGSSLLEFVARHSEAKTAKALRGGDVKVKFGDYDWSLNGS